MRKFRNWLSDRCYAIARRFEDLGGNLYVPNRSRRVGLTADLIVATLRANEGKLLDNVVRNNALLRSLAGRK